MPSAPKKTEGPPCNIIIKFIYYRTKETLRRAAGARDQLDLSIQGHHYQLFANLSSITIQKRRLHNGAVYLPNSLPLGLPL